MISPLKAYDYAKSMPTLNSPQFFIPALLKSLNLPCLRLGLTTSDQKQICSHHSVMLAGVLTLIVALLPSVVVAANGTWISSSADGNWSGTNNWSAGIVADSSASIADFSTLDLPADRSVHLDTARTINTLKFGDTSIATPGNWILDNNGVAGNILTLAGTTPTITVTNTATISGVLSGSFTKSGTGTLILTNSNTLTGNITVASGTIRITKATALGNATKTMVLTAAGADKMLELDGSNGNITLGSGISFTVSEQEGAIRNLSGDNTINGNISIQTNNGGAKIISNNGTLTLAGNIIPLAATRVLELAGTSTGSNTLSGTIANSGTYVPSVTKSDVGTWILSGINTCTGGTKVTGGLLICTKAESLGLGPLDITTGAKLQLNYSGTRQVSALSFNAGTARPNGTYGSNSSPAENKNDAYFAGTGTVTVGPIRTQTSATVNLTAGSNPSLFGASITFTGNIVGTNPSGTVNFYSGANLIGTSPVTNSQANLTTNSLPIGTNSILVRYSGDAANEPSTSSVISVVINTPVGTNYILTFNFPNLPAPSISNNNISVTVPYSTDLTNLAPTYTVSAGATGNPSSGTAKNFTTPQTYRITDASQVSRDYTVTVTRSTIPILFTWSGNTNGIWSDATKWSNEISSGSTPTSTGQSDYTINLNTSGNFTSTHDLSSGFLLNKLNLGGSTLTLSGNSLSFLTNLSSLPQLNQNSSSPANVTVPLVLASNLEFGGSGSGQVTLSGVISGSGSLTKNGAGELKITSLSNTYAGGTVINGGQLTMFTAANAALGTGPITLNNATLFLEKITASNALTLNGGTIIASNASGNTWNGPVTLNATSTVNATQSMIFSAEISGTGGLTKSGISSLTLSGSNRFLGPLSIQAGTLAVTSLNRVSGGTTTSDLGAPNSIANGTLTFGSGSAATTLTYTGPGETTDRVIKLVGTTGGLTITQSGTAAGATTARGESGLLKFAGDILIPGTAATDNRKTITLHSVSNSLTGPNPGRGEIAGNIGDSLLGNSGQTTTGITKSGPGTWTLSGNNSYSGATRIQAGTLAFSRSNALGSNSLDISTGAKAQLDFVGTRSITSLTYNAGTPQANGTYGSSSSIATFKDNTRFSGLGTITIGSISTPTTTSLVISNSGLLTILTATVSGNSPNGSVVFYDGLTVIGTATLNSSFQASIATVRLAGGTHRLSALYLGSGSNPPSSTTIDQTVIETRPPTITTLSRTGGFNPSNFGGSVTFTAQVTGANPTGFVTLYDGIAEVFKAELNSSGHAIMTISGLGIGWRPLTARYAGDLNNAPSSTTSTLFQTINPPVGNGKLKVFILAGQSNMVGKGRVETGRDPSNANSTSIFGGLGSLRNMVNREPNKYSYLSDPSNPVNGYPGWQTRSDVWVSYWGESNAENRRGNLDADFGDYGAQGRIGPEYGFGLVAGSQLADQVLLIKYAFGGKSLIADFRPPSSGGTTGAYYTGMVARVHQVLDNLKTFFPAYNEGGYELVGLGWHQGWNDLGQETAVYETNLTNLIKDLRTEFQVPNMRVSIGITGMANANASSNSLKIIAAQMNVANATLHPEFAGTVTSVDTRPFDYGTLLGSSDEGYHWNWSAESYYNIGDSMGKAMMSVLPSLSSANQILSFGMPNQTQAVISGASINLTVASGVSLTTLSPEFTLSPYATATPVSGSMRDFTTPQTYTVTAQNGSVQIYTVSATLNTVSSYSSWSSAASQGLSLGVNDGFLDDPDHDNIPNITEFALAGSPLISSLSILPQLTRVGGNWFFNYDRNRLSLPPATNQTVEYGSDLIGWTSIIIPATGNDQVTIISSSTVDHVSVKIPNAGTRTFARLKITP